MTQRLTRRPALLVFSAALLVRIAWVLTLEDALAWPDEHEFVQIGRHLATGDGFVASSYRSNPVLPAFLGAAFRLFGESYLAARLAQAFAGALTCALVARTASLLSGSAVGALAGLLLAFYPPHIYLSGVFYVECLFTLFLAASVHLAVRGAQSASPLATGLLCGVTCGVTILSRSVFAAAVPALCAAWLWAAGARWRAHLPACAALLLGAAVTVAPWTARNLAVFGRLVPVSSGFYTTLWQGNSELSAGDADDRLLFWDAPSYWEPRLRRLAAPERDAVRRRYEVVGQRTEDLQQHGIDRYLATDLLLRPIAIDEIRSHPGRTARLFLRKLRTLYSGITATDTAHGVTAPRSRALGALAFYPLLVLATLGAALGVRAHRGFAIPLALVASLSCTYAVLTACARFRLPLDPYLLLFGAVALMHLGQRVGAVQRSRRAAARAAAGGGLRGIAAGPLCALAWLLSAPARRRARIRLHAGTPLGSVLVFNPVAGVGNLVLLTGLLLNLRRLYPAARIAVAMPASPAARAIIPPPLADDLLFFDAGATSRRALLRFARRELRPRRFDLGLATFFAPTVLSSAVLLAAGCRYRVAYGRSRTRGFLNTYTLTDRGGSEFDRHLRLLEFSGAPLDPRTALAVDRAQADAAARLLAARGLGRRRPVLGVHPGSDRANALKRWPLERFAAVVDQIVAAERADVIVFIGPDEAELSAALAPRLDGRAWVVADEPLECVAALVGRCDAFLSNDSGLMHIAAALGVPTVAIFGPTSEEKNTPPGAVTVLVAPEVSCRPCYTQPPITCPYERRHCLEQIGTDDAVRALERVLPPAATRRDGEHGADDRPADSPQRAAGGGGGRFGAWSR